MFTFNWYQDAILTYFSIDILIDCHPYIDIFCFRQKGGEKFIDLVLVFTPLLMIDKKGENYLRSFLYA